MKVSIPTVFWSESTRSRAPRTLSDYYWDVWLLFRLLISAEGAFEWIFCRSLLSLLELMCASCWMIFLVNVKSLSVSQSKSDGGEGTERPGTEHSRKRMIRQCDGVSMSRSFRLLLLSASDYHKLWASRPSNQQSACADVIETNLWCQSSRILIYCDSFIADCSGFVLIDFKKIFPPKLLSRSRSWWQCGVLSSVDKSLKSLLNYQNTSAHPARESPP